MWTAAVPAPSCLGSACPASWLSTMRGALHYSILFLKPQSIFSPSKYPTSHPRLPAVDLPLTLPWSGSFLLPQHSQYHPFPAPICSILHFLCAAFLLDNIFMLLYGYDCPSTGRHYSLGVAHQASKEISVLSSVQDISEQSCGCPDQVVRPDRDIKVILPALLGFFQFFPLFLSSPWRVRHFKVLSLISVTEISSVLLFILASVFFCCHEKACL